MSIESEVFKRRKISFDKLLAFGFSKVGEVYALNRVFYPNFIAVLTVSEAGKVHGSVRDAEFGDEYVNFRLDDCAAFATGVKNSYISFLEEVRDATSDPLPFLTPQANRIASAVMEKYGVLPEFLWQRYPNYGVFRRSESGKWFGIIMDLDRSKVAHGEMGETDVLNLKADSRVEEFISHGAYPCFHMSQKYWVSLLLDDRVSDDEILEMLDWSYTLVKKKNR